MTIALADVATDADLEKYTLGRRNLQMLLPEEWATDPEEDSDDETNPKLATIALQTALDDVLKHLSRRRPPIRENDIVYPEELKQAVCYGALEILYRGAADHEDSPNYKRAKRYGELFAGEKNSLQPEVRAGSTASSMTIRMSRG